MSNPQQQPDFNNTEPDEAESYPLSFDDVENDNYCVFCGAEWYDTDNGKRCDHCGYDEPYERGKRGYEEA